MTTTKKIAFALTMAIVSCAALVSQAATITYFHNDLAGSPVAATNASGQVIWRESYRPYGERTVNSASASDNKVWFTSRRQDLDTGLVYMGARYYDPVAGRFVSTDPVGFDDKNVHSHIATHSCLGCLRQLARRLHIFTYPVAHKPRGGAIRCLLRNFNEATA